MASCNRVGSFLQSPFQLFRTAVAAATAVAVARTCRVVSSIYVSSSGDEAESVCETEIIACSDLIYCQTKKITQLMLRIRMAGYLLSSTQDKRSKTDRCATIAIIVRKELVLKFRLKKRGKMKVGRVRISDTVSELHRMKCKTQFSYKICLNN